MEKKTFVMTIEALNKLGNCFASPEEVKQFDKEMLDTVDELYFYYQMRSRINDTQDSATVLLKQIAWMTLFFRDNMELIHQLVAKCEATKISEDEMNHMTGQ